MEAKEPLCCLAYLGIPAYLAISLFESVQLRRRSRFEVPGAARTHHLSVGELMERGLQTRTHAFEILALVVPPCLERDFTILRTVVPGIAARPDVQTLGLR